MGDDKKIKTAYLLAFMNLLALMFVLFLHGREMWRVQREIFSLQEDVISLHERVAKLQKATFGVAERSSTDKLPTAPIRPAETARKRATTDG